MSTFLSPGLSLDRDSASGIRTLPELVEFHVKHNPQHRFCIQAEKPLIENGAYQLTPVSYERLQQAILRCQAWLRHNAPNIHASFLDDHGIVKRCASVAVLMESHTGLAVFILTLMGMGVPVVLLSTRLSPVAISHLMRTTRAQHALVSQRLQPLIVEARSIRNSELDKECSPEVYIAPGYEIFLDKVPVTYDGKIAHPNHFISESDCQALILHSSGTSGLPKPVYCSHKSFLGFAICHSFSSEIEAHNLTVSTSPFFHGFGLVPMCMSLGIGKTMCLTPPFSIPTGTSVAALLEESGAKALLAVPSIIEEIALLPGDRGVRILQNLDFVAFGGGMPKESVGKKLQVAGVRLINHYGATETGPLSPFFVPTESYDWHYIKLRPDTFAPLEVQLDPVDAHDCTFKMSMRPFGWTERFELQDVLVRKPGSHEEDMEFSIQGRNDDLICLATGEKVRPTILESLLRQHHGVKAATAFGDGRFELGVIVETIEPLEASRIEAFKASIWPLIEEAGHSMDAHARISSQAAVLVFPPGLLPRSDKGTILRLEVAKTFSEEIDQVYRELESNVTAPPLDYLSPETTIRSLIEDNIKLGSNFNSWTDEDDLFELGMDSLQAVKLRRLLIASLKATNADSNNVLKPGDILGDFVYRHASVAKLVEAMTSNRTVVNDASDPRWLEELVEEYCVRDSVRLQKATVAITGATGSLGSHFLNVLLHDPSVDRVICLNRRTGDDAVTRQKKALASRGIAVSDELFTKVEVLEISSATENLGLSAMQYESLAREITHIVHIAWPMNFKMTLPSFNGTFRTLQNLIQLACDAHSQAPRKRPKVLFVSSISTVGNYPAIKAERIVPEVAVDDHSWTLGVGYAKAKLVCEKMIQRAAKDHPEIEAGLVRFGQIAGSSTGYWNSDEHVAALVASSLTVGKFPDLRGTLSWMRVDSCAAVLAEVMFHSLPLELVYHLENPIRQSWQDFAAVLVRRLGLPKESIVPMDNWLKLVDCGPSEGNPAQGLLDFFTNDFVKMSDGSIVLDTAITRSVSPTLRKMSQITESDIAAYVEYWRSVGLLGRM
ncbi:hypothetical protein HBI24_172510 [Parastagonospora nodorum]|nr:hypothetical protein HBH51_105530 [Parastagonospora nodorum]KAH5577689.1 hypothetical protein HBI24_172510 [Parastagonospora nodorum]KAH5616677.1 hypothetical protein HBI45_001810 [Parastagonospora nodorum]KAH6411017.1 hypothetical protein HBI14_146880 [Parastagonospora nodorum]